MVENASGCTNVTSTTTYVNILEVTINVPAAGKVLVIGSAYIDVASDFGGGAFVGIATTSNGSPINARQRAGAGSAGIDDVPVTTQYLKTVAAGSHTFYMVALKVAGTATVAACRPQLSATFFPD